MAIQINDNIKVNAGKPVDSKYLNLSNVAYVSVAEAIVTIPISERHIGLTVNVAGVEYFWKNGVNDNNLVIKETQIGLNISGSAVTLTTDFADSDTGNITFPYTGYFNSYDVTQVGKTVLFYNRNNPVENGIWIINAGTWTRSTTMDTVSDVFTGLTVKGLQLGNSGNLVAGAPNTIFKLVTTTFSGGPALGTQPLNFTSDPGISSVVGDLKNLRSFEIAGPFTPNSPVSLGKYNFTNVVSTPADTITIGNGIFDSNTTGVQDGIYIGNNVQGINTVGGSYNIFLSTRSVGGSEHCVDVTGNSNVFIGGGNLYNSGSAGPTINANRNVVIGQKILRVNDSVNNPYDDNIIIGVSGSFQSILDPGNFVDKRLNVIIGNAFIYTTDNGYMYRNGLQNVSTTNATVTTLKTVTIPSNTTVLLKATVVARRTGGSAGAAGDSASYEIAGTFRENAGTVAQVGTTTVLITHESQAGWDCVFDISGLTVRVRVTGAVNNNINWIIRKLEFIDVA